MSKPEWVGLAVLGCGAALGVALGGTIGLAFAGGCLVVGLVLLVAREALGTTHKPAVASAQAHTHLLVLLKEVHIRPQRDGKFQEIDDPNQAGLEFEIFLHCWLVNDTDDRLGIAGIRLALTRPGGTPMELKRVSADLDSWRLGRLRDELDSFGVRYLQAEQEPLPELHIEEPLEAGATRQGWLHLRAQGITPTEMKNSKLELEVIDSRMHSHFGEVKGPHVLPGRVWPYRLEPTSQVAEKPASQETSRPPEKASGAVSP
ncbi:MAG TPA: hypothetical protein VLL05_14955 [Terriglobales bacterium]|nr:hypothetical protein [Terriglobales bacterium]